MEGIYLRCCSNGVMEWGGPIGMFFSQVCLCGSCEGSHKGEQKGKALEEKPPGWKAVHDCWAQLPVALSPSATCVHSLLSQELCSQTWGLLGMPQLKLWLLPAPAVGWTGCYLIPEQLTVTLLQGIMSGDSKEETFQLCWLKISLLTHHWSMAGEVGAWPCKSASCCPQNLRVSTKELIPWLKIFCTMYLSPCSCLLWSLLVFTERLLPLWTS